MKAPICHPEKKYYAKELCRNCYMIAHRRRHPEYVEYMRAYCKEWRTVPENRARDSAYRKGYRKDPSKSWIKELGLRSNRKQKYGLSEREYQALLAEHEYQCAICGSKERLCIDHCHTSGKVRGILCNGCNTGLGMFREAIPSLLKAVDYLFERRVVGAAK
jgi:hypothetical protein